MTSHYRTAGEIMGPLGILTGGGSGMSGGLSQNDENYFAPSSDPIWYGDGTEPLEEYHPGNQDFGDGSRSNWWDDIKGYVHDQFDSIPHTLETLGGLATGLPIREGADLVTNWWNSQHPAHGGSDGLDEVNITAQRPQGALSSAGDYNNPWDNPGYTEPRQNDAPDEVTITGQQHQPEPVAAVPHPAASPPTPAMTPDWTPPPAPTEGGDSGVGGGAQSSPDFSRRFNEYGGDYNHYGEGAQHAFYAAHGGAVARLMQMARAMRQR